MDRLFLTILNMSLTGAFVIAVICVARLPLKKAPKIISYCLWAVAGFRLVFPYSIESVFSLVPFKAQTIPPDIAMQPIPRIDSGIPFINNAVNSILPAAAPTASVNPLQVWTAIGARVWIIGVAVLLIYGLVSFFVLKRKMNEAARIEANIYEAENIKSPFVLGFTKPRIYLPIGLSEQEKSYIIMHEQTHIKRYDHIIKFAAYFILCLHWFNPFTWVAFVLMGVDMEMSCDECVLKEMGGEAKKNYSLSLLSLATERRIIGGSPLAFGEGGIKERIKNILNFKKPSRVTIIVAVALVTVLSVGFAMEAVSPTTYEPQKWVDFFRDEELPWASTYDLMLDEFPGVVFSWTSGKVTATENNSIKDLFTGMPVWNVYLADLSGDGLPELCATVSFGSGIVDTRVIVYDYANDGLYDLSDRGYYDYFLSIKDSQLVVTQVKFLDNLDNDILAIGSMAIIDGELVTFELDRTLPEPSPQEWYNQLSIISET